MAKNQHRPARAETLNAEDDLLDRVADALRRDQTDVALNPRALNASQVATLLNSTPLGETISAETVRRHRSRAGMRIGDGRSIDLFRYAAWLHDESHKSPEKGLSQPPQNGDPSGAYERHKERARQRQADESKQGRDIGEIPPPANPDRRFETRHNFRRFCEVYFAGTFKLAWSSDHLKVIQKIQGAVIGGGQFAMAMPRGTGKSSLCEAAVLWAVLHGHRRYVVLIGADQGAANRMLANIWTTLEAEGDSAADFPEVCLPIAALEGITQKKPLYRGERILQSHSAKEIVLPWIEESGAKGNRIVAAGLTCGFRGLSKTRPDGEKVRPDLVIVDDPQTDKSARNPAQCAVRENILAGAVLGLAGPGSKIAAVCPCTVIRPDDMADRILDRQRHPEWQGERTRMVNAFPTNEARWGEYREIRAEAQRLELGPGPGNDYYRLHQVEMDAGADVAWPERFDDDELSAIQHAMNLRYDRGDEVFFSEFQNAPLVLDGDDELLKAPEICEKLSRFDRGLVPHDALKLTAFVDVQQDVLFWMVCAWGTEFTGWIVDYGTWPEQAVPYFTLKTLTMKLRANRRQGIQEAIFAGLDALTHQLITREFPRDGGGVARVDRLLIDSGYETDLVFRFCRQSPHTNVMPSRGEGIKAGSTPMDKWAKKPGDEFGSNWLITRGSKGRPIRHVVIDVNWWKSFVMTRLGIGLGGKGCLSLFGTEPGKHRLLADHLTAEYRTKTSGRGRDVWEWAIKPERGDNHWFDTLVGCAAAASIERIGLEELRPVTPARRTFQLPPGARRR